MKKLLILLLAHTIAYSITVVAQSPNIIGIEILKPTYFESPYQKASDSTYVKFTMADSDSLIATGFYYYYSKWSYDKGADFYKMSLDSLPSKVNYSYNVNRDSLVINTIIPNLKTRFNIPDSEISAK